MLKDGDWYSAKPGKVWREIEIPFKKFVVFIDTYRGNKPHFAALSDFLVSFTQFQEDYEDYTPDKIILYASDNLYEIFNWYLNYLNIKKVTDISSKYSSTADSEFFFEEIFNKTWKANDFLAKTEPTKDDLMDYTNYWCTKII